MQGAGTETRAETETKAETETGTETETGVETATASGIRTGVAATAGRATRVDRGRAEKRTTGTGTGGGDNMAARAVSPSLSLAKTVASCRRETSVSAFRVGGAGCGATAQAEALRGEGCSARVPWKCGLAGRNHRQCVRPLFFWTNSALAACHRAPLGSSSMS